MLNYNFKIKRNKNTIEPEEILLDKNNDKENFLDRLEWPIKPLFIKIVFWLSIGLFLIVLSRLVYLQIVKGDFYTKRAENNRLRYYYINAPRGIIYDRNNNPLVLNIPSYSLILVPVDLPFNQDEKKQTIETVASIFNLKPEEILARLEEKKEINIEPILIKTNLEVEEVRRFETQIGNTSGFEIIEDNSRYYPYKEAMAHLIGYVGKMSKEDLEKYPHYPLTSIIGKTGLENYYENYLQGKPGKRLIEVNASYTIIKDLGSTDPTKGYDLITTIDKDLQLKLYESLLHYTNQLNIKGATGIALNPKTGEILAMVSLPSFDPNILTKGSPAKTIENYFNNPFHPLFNRAIAGLYHPGSTIKPLMAIAALEEKIIDPKKQIYDDEGEIIITSPYDPNQKYVYRDWKKHGWVDLKKAIAVSCNIYFWTVGGGYKEIKGLGIEKIKKYWLDFYLDKKTGIDLNGEALGVLPDQEWIKYNRKNDPVWKLGDTYNVSIGEGNLLLTPLQIINYISTLANEGKVMKPYLVKTISSLNLNLFTQEPTILHSLNASLDNIKLVNQGMREVVLSGTGQSLKYLPFEIAGKSGSPKFLSGGREAYHSIFVSYAPYENPEIALIVLLEKPPAGSLSVLSITEEVLNWYYYNRIANKDSAN